MRYPELYALMARESISNAPFRPRHAAAHDRVVAIRRERRLRAEDAR